MLAIARRPTACPRRPARWAALGLLAALAACRENGSRSVIPVVEAAPGAGSPAVEAAAPAAEPAGPRRAGGQAPAQRLELGETLEGRFSGPQPVAYAIGLRRGEYAHVVVEQRGVDVALDLFAPAGGPLLALDSPNSASGPEHLFVLAAEDGGHRLEVRPFPSAAGGSFTVTLGAT